MIRARFSVIDDPEISGYVQSIVSRIQKQMPPQPFEIKPNVINNNSMNAFATVAGYMFVFSGLILKMEHEAELASVIAHELGHVSQRHVAHNIERAQWASLGSLLGLLAGVFVGSASNDASSAIVAGSLAGGQSALLKYSRRDEREADQIGMNFLVNSGYNPEAMVSAFEKIRKAKQLMGSSIPSYLSTHPGVNERLAYLEERVDRFPDEFKLRPYNDKRLHRVQTLLRARYTDPQTALRYFRDDGKRNALEYLGLGIVLSRLNRIKEAKQAFDKALKAESEDSLFLREAGQFYYSYGQLEVAAEYLQKAVFLAPRDVMALFYYSRVLAEQKRYREAASFLQQVVDKIPDDAQVRRELGKVYGRMNDMFSAHLQMAYAFLYSRKKSNLEFHLKKAETLASTSRQEDEIEDFKEEYKQDAKFW
ncbi:MAG: M48 family metalloprotease [Thermodesulfobacteriota bacterium]